MRYAVLGAGGVGGLVGGVLAKAGHPVTLLVRPGRRDHDPERLTVESETLGTFEAPVRVIYRLNGQFDVVWITVTRQRRSRRHFAPSLRRSWAMASSYHYSTACTMSNTYANATDPSGSCRGLYGSKQSRWGLGEFSISLRSWTCKTRRVRPRPRRSSGGLLPTPS